MPKGFYQRIAPVWNKEGKTGITPWNKGKTYTNIKVLLCIKCGIPIKKRSPNGRRLCEEHLLESYRLFREKYAISIKKTQLNYRKKHPNLSKDWFKKHPGYLSGWQKKNRKSISEQENKRYHTNINYRLKKILRNRVFSLLRGINKDSSVLDKLGCSIDELKIYLEKQFKKGMTWDNHSFYGWHIDHIRPLSYYNLNDPKQFNEACHYTNLQPLWGRDNLIKSNKY